MASRAKLSKARGAGAGAGAGSGAAAGRGWGWLVVLVFVFAIVMMKGAEFMYFSSAQGRKFIEGTEAKVDALIQDAGFVLDDVLAKGLVRTSRQEIYAVTGLQAGMPIFAVDTEVVRQKLLALPWVKEAIVKRELPSRVKIDITEHNPIAIWQDKGRYYPITDAGLVLPAGAGLAGMADMPVISGEGAAKVTPYLLEVLADFPLLYKRFKGAVRVNKRRWDIIFNDLEKGVLVSLPEDNMEGALDRLDKWEEKYLILKRKLTFIDLRLVKMLVVRP